MNCHFPYRKIKNPEGSVFTADVEGWQEKRAVKMGLLPIAVPLCANS